MARTLARLCIVAHPWAAMANGAGGRVTPSSRSKEVTRMNVVFGASGRTGRVVAAELEARARVAVRRVTRSAAPRDQGVGEVVAARWTDDAELGAALKGARAVYAILPDDLRATAFRAERRAMA